MREVLPGGFVVTETKVSPKGNVTLVVVVPDGRKVTVHLPKGTDTPEGIAAMAMARLTAPDKRKATR
jgi:hypothetical protein